MAQQAPKLSILLVGESTGGKTHSLRKLRNVLWLDAESMKEIPFRHDSSNKVKNITDPKEALKFLRTINAKPELQEKYSGGIVLDSFSFLMSKYETQYINAPTVEDTRSAWGSYKQFILDIMDEVSKLTIPFIATVHLTENLKSNKANALQAAIAGSIGKKEGLEAYFSTIVHAMPVDVEMLEDGDHEKHAQGLLNISKRDKRKGVKYVYKLQHFGDDSDATTALIRMSEQVFEDGIIDEDAQYMDNDITLLIERLHAFHTQ
ncbi:hypothetical protein NVP1261O_56 [Vibrio phage 1.261.O._10N.286.51.A7]|uniref:AAA domain protein n=2 Tax=Mukerjeevirus TaxID=2733146 RepID=A0A2I7RRZ3_9CAUD|nr:hypothetical protein HOU79_gp47 [Vibrio phage 1.224.A._10N.261.48.B1]YP_009817741.1 hypothetical protein HOU80_gp46 [Vibrio phage 1.261.O._10N.286.51.A7]AUR96426.1 hypothetical protein NVP1224A_59 [Vibrio phage 1.224.A._10N.261.48.B1]AUR99060.1 hypothetical protein NVP1261O_56 [Vibrio phage 1.261.O._10N.286.51.A7]